MRDSVYLKHVSIFLVGIYVAVMTKQKGNVK